MTDVASNAPAPRSDSRAAATQALNALGLLFGVVAIAPLFALRTAFADSALAPTPVNVVGVVSLLIWSLLIVAGAQCLVFVLRADCEGEGGILALLAQARRAAGRSATLRAWTVVLGLIGAGLLISQVVLLPGLSARSALEGLRLDSPDLQSALMPGAVAAIVVVFLLQRGGLHRSTLLFGPLIALWLLLIAWLGVLAIAAKPEVLSALSPAPGVAYLARNGCAGFASLGAIVLAVAGLDLLHAGLGEFGARSIRVAALFAIPALVLCYLGQGALLLDDPSAATQPFYRLVSRELLPGVVGLALIVATIASRALLTAVYVLLREAGQLGYLPRLRAEAERQGDHEHLYLPGLNGMLLLLAVGALLALHSVARLGAAYALCVAATIVATSVLLLAIARWQWHWDWIRVGAFAAFFGSVDLALFGGAALHGQQTWFALAIAASALALMLIWRHGRDELLALTSAGSLPLESFCSSIAAHPPIRVDVTAVFLTARPHHVPQALLHNLRYNHVLHRCNVILTVETVDAPSASESERFELTDLGNGFHRVVLRFGFAENIHVPAVLRRFAPATLNIGPATAYFLGRELISSEQSGVRGWRAGVFAFMARNAIPAHAYFHIPSNQLIEIGLRWKV